MCKILYENLPKEWLISYKTAALWVTWRHQSWVRVPVPPVINTAETTRLFYILSIYISHTRINYWNVTLYLSSCSVKPNFMIFWTSHCCPVKQTLMDRFDCRWQEKDGKDSAAFMAFSGEGHSLRKKQPPRPRWSTVIFLSAVLLTFMLCFIPSSGVSSTLRIICFGNNLSLWNLERKC